MIETRFKDTEIGLVPVEWDVKRLGEIGTLAMCKRIFQNETSQVGDVPFYKIGTFGQKADAYITHAKYETFKKAYRFPKVGDILISAAGTIGRTVVYDGKPAYFQDSNIVWLAHNESIVVNQLLFYLYKQIEWNTENTTIARLYNGNFNYTKISFPASLPEQRRIASALTAVDDLLASLDRMIEKKRNIKQGAMQQLLTGKTRLEGFSEPWGEKTLGEIEIKNGSMLRSSDYQLGSIPVIAGGKKPTGYHSVSNRQGHTITISGSGANAGYVAFYDQPIFASDCSTINEQDNIDIKCLFFLLLLKQNDIYKCQAGGAQPHIHAKDIKDISINMPKNISEQRAIARILTDMDDEIAALEKKRDKYVALKDGMMQQLLTGKIRLVN